MLVNKRAEGVPRLADVALGTVLAFQLVYHGLLQLIKEAVHGFYSPSSLIILDQNSGV